jgi:glycosyltransferase involved in cell wall biosynthesis
MPKKILIIFWGNPFFDGRCMNLLEQLLNADYNIKMLCVGNISETKNYKGAELHFINQKKLENTLTKYFIFFKYVKQFIIENKPQIIIASDLYSMIPAAQSKTKHKARLIYDSRELYTKLAGLNKRPLMQKIWSYYERKNIQHVDNTIVTAEIDRQYLHKLYSKNISIIIAKNLPGNNFLNTPTKSLRSIFYISEDKNILVYQGKFHKGRGIRFVIKCLVHMKKAVLVLIGDGPMKQGYLKEAINLKVKHKIFFVDAVKYNDLASFSKDVQIGLSMIQPITKSYEHALPNKLFEYAVSGIPTICSNLIAMKEMISQYHSGICVHHDSQEEFISAYHTIIKDPSQFILNKEIRKSLLWKENNKLKDILHD